MSSPEPAPASQPRGLSAGVARVRDRIRHLGQAAESSYARLRWRWPSVDHLARAVERYNDQQGSHLSGGVTYYTFLSFFPLIALAFALVGYVSFANEQVHTYLEAAIADVLPGLASELPLEQIEDARHGAGIIGLLGLVYAGLGAMSAMRQALRAIWMKADSPAPNIVVAKLGDALAMLIVGGVLLASVALTGVVQTSTTWLLEAVGLASYAPVALLTRALGLGVTLGADTVVFLVLFGKMSGTGRPWRMLWRGALLAAVGFELLKLLAALLLRSTLDDPVYASFAVVVGLLVWINIVVRTVLFAAAWTATWLPTPPGTAAGRDAAAPRSEAGRPPRVRPRASDRRTGAILVGLAGAAVVAYGVWRRRRRVGSAWPNGDSMNADGR